MERHLLAEALGRRPPPSLEVRAEIIERPCCLATPHRVLPVGDARIPVEHVPDTILIHRFVAVRLHVLVSHVAKNRLHVPQHRSGSRSQLKLRTPSAWLTATRADGEERGEVWDRSRPSGFLLRRPGRLAQLDARDGVDRRTRVEGRMGSSSASAISVAYVGVAFASGGVGAMP